LAAARRLRRTTGTVAVTTLRAVSITPCDVERLKFACQPSDEWVLGDHVLEHGQALLIMLEAHLVFVLHVVGSGPLSARDLM
jgi:hypothetical protein